MTSKNPESKGQKGGKEELVSINSLDQLKRELKSENLDTSKDEYFKEKQIKIKIAKSELNKLSEEIKWAWEDQEKILNLLKQFITSKEQTKENSRHWIDTLKSQIESNLNTFGLDGIKKSLETIEAIPVEKVQERWFLTNMLIGAIESKWYKIYLEKNRVKIDSIGELTPELETVINNYIAKNQFNFENFRTAILYRTTKLDDYVKSNTNLKWELITDWIDSKKYYDFLIEKYCMKSVFGTSENDIKNNSKIDQKDKAFLISYKNNAFDDYKISNDIKNYDLFVKAVKAKVEQSQANNAWVKQDNKEESPKSVNERIGNFIKDPFSEMWKVMEKAWPIWWLAIIGALIYYLFTEPKIVLWTIWTWSVLKWVWIADELWDSFGKNVRNKENKETKNQEKVNKIQEKEAHLSEWQKLATQRVRNNNWLVKNIDKMPEDKWKINDYLIFINSDSFQWISHKDLFYNKNTAENILSNERSLNPKIQLPSNLDPLVFKRVLRVYFNCPQKIDVNKENPWSAELKEFEVKYLSQSSTKEKDISLKELSNIIYTKTA